MEKIGEIICLLLILRIFYVFLWCYWEFDRFDADKVEWYPSGRKQFERFLRKK